MMPLIKNYPIYHGDQIAEVTTYQGSLSLRVHAMGFLEIASLTSRAVLDGKTEIDAITPAIIYSIRHAIELFLKSIIEDMRETHRVTTKKMNNNGEMKDVSRTGHLVQILWDEHKQDLAAVLNYETSHSQFDDRAWLNDFDEIVQAVHLIDPDGQTFRYPANKKSSPHFGGKLSVSIGQLEQFANHVKDCFICYIERES